MTIIQESVDKTLIHKMPQLVFYGRIEIVDTLQKAQTAISELWKESAVGFDTETRPSFHKGVNYKISLLQLSTLSTAYLFRLNKIGLPDFVVEFLASPKVKKVGISLKDDFRALSQRTKVSPEGFVELQQYIPSFGIAEKGLQRIYALLFGRRISKSQTLSNWEADPLTEGQKQYASIDAWACLEIYRYMSQLKESGQYRIVKKPVPQVIEDAVTEINTNNAESKEGNTEER